ncbi:MAG: hypothetical protein ACFFDI_09780, partial [Promethearchaeota archaeon]
DLGRMFDEVPGEAPGTKGTHSAAPTWVRDNPVISISLVVPSTILLDFEEEGLFSFISEEICLSAAKTWLIGKINSIKVARTINDPSDK